MRTRILHLTLTAVASLAGLGTAAITATPASAGCDPAVQSCAPSNDNCDPAEQSCAPQGGCDWDQTCPTPPRPRPYGLTAGDGGCGPTMKDCF